MTLKLCKCGKIISTKNCRYDGKSLLGLSKVMFFTCLNCYSTSCLTAKAKGNETWSVVRPNNRDTES